MSRTQGVRLRVANQGASAALPWLAAKRKPSIAPGRTATRTVGLTTAVATITGRFQLAASWKRPSPAPASPSCRAVLGGQQVNLAAVEAITEVGIDPPLSMMGPDFAESLEVNRDLRSTLGRLCCSRLAGVVDEVAVTRLGRRRALGTVDQFCEFST